MTTRKTPLRALIGFVGVAGIAASAAVQVAGSDRSDKSAGVVTATWVGPSTGGLWSDPANWDTVAFPNNGNGGLNYDVFINSPVNAPAIINLDTDVVIESLFQRGALDAQSGPANLTINGPWDWQGVILGPGTTRANGGITNPTFTVAIQIIGERIVENAGLATSLKFSLVNGAQFDNLAVGTISFQPSHTIGSTNGGVLNNFGLLQVDSTLFVQGVFNNHGTVDVQGSLHLRSSGTHSGQFRVASLTSLFVEPDTGTNVFTETSSMTGLGGVRFGGTEAVSLNGGFALSGLATAAVPALTFANAPTGSGFSLEVGSTFGPPSVVRFESGVPALGALTVPPLGTLHIVGDANVSGALRWDGTMSGPGTTTTTGPVRAVTGLTLDGRTVVASGGFRWQGSDFVLDNGAVLENAQGSTFTIDVIRPRSIGSSTPANPGRMVNAGITSQIDVAPVTIMTDWRQTPTGALTAESLSFQGNTDISGSVMVPSGFRNAITFAGPDTGGTITHRLRPDSTLTALGTVNVGDPNGSGIDIINSEFAGNLDLSDSRATLSVHGANTTLSLPSLTGGGTVAGGDRTLSAVTVTDGDLEFNRPILSACCTDSGCIEVVWSACQGFPLDFGTRCSDVSCGAGACCFTDAPCTVVQEPNAFDACDALGGRYEGPGSSCFSCPIFGACCQGLICTRESPFSCGNIGGVFQGRDSTCDVGTCGPQPGLAVSIGNLTLQGGTVEVHTPLGNESSTVSVDKTLIATGVSIVKWVGEQPGDWTVGGFLLRSPGDLTVSNANLTAKDPRPCEWDFAFEMDLVDGATFNWSGPDAGPRTQCFLGARGALVSSDETGTALFDGVRLRFGGNDDPVGWFEVSLPVTLRNTTIERQFDSAPHTTTVWKDVVFQEDVEIDGVTVKVIEAYTDTSGFVCMTNSTVVVGPDGHPFISRAESISLDNSGVGTQAADGSPIAGVVGTGVFSDPFFTGGPSSPTAGPVVVSSVLSFGSVGSPNDTVHAVISPGDTRPNGLANALLAGIGTLTMTGRNAVIASGSVLRADVDPLAVGQRNDRFEIVATTTTFAAALTVSLAPGSECAVLPTDAFMVVTGAGITYPNGGDGLRILTTGGEGSFVVNQGSTGIVLDGFLLGGDANRDRTVNTQDTASFVPCMQGPGQPPSPACEGCDFNADGGCDLDDFSLLQKNFGTSCP